MTAITYILFAIGLVCGLLAVLALLFPKAAFFLKEPSRLKAFSFYLVFGLACMIGAAFAAPEEMNREGEVIRLAQQEKDRQQKAEKEAQEKAREHERQKEKEAAAKEAAARKSAMENPLPFREDTYENTSFATRKRGKVWITLTDPVQDFSPYQLVATCMGAAKHYARANGLKAVSVFLMDMPGDKPWEGTNLASCAYSPDSGGFSGQEKWEWGEVRAISSPLTDQDRQMKKLWGEGRAKGLKTEKEVEKNVAQKMGIKPEEVHLPFAIPERVDHKGFENMQELAPVK